MPWIWVSVGSNMDRETNIRAGIHALGERFGELKLSPVYETEAVGFVGDAFLNMVLGFYTELPLKDVRRLLRDIEHAQGRIRDGQKFGSRTQNLVPEPWIWIFSLMLTWWMNPKISLGRKSCVMPLCWPPWRMWRRNRCTRSWVKPMPGCGRMFRAARLV